MLANLSNSGCQFGREESYEQCDLYTVENGTNLGDFC